jgi:hypothetical protein
VNRGDLKTAVLFDLDSCLADTRHRWHLSPMADPSSTWARYCAARIGDTPIPGTVTAARLHYPHHQVNICSGSEASAEQVTRIWLDRHRVPYDGLALRTDPDASNADCKVRYIEFLRSLGIETVLFYEDHPDVARDIEERTGVPVACVNARYPEDAHKFRQTAFDNRGGGL